MERLLQLIGALGLAGSGCAQLAGIQETTSPPESATFDLQRVSIGAKVVTAPQDLGTGVPKFLVPSGSDPSGLAQIAAMQTMPGEWHASAAGAIGVTYTVPDVPTPSREALEFGQVESGNHVVFEHPNAMETGKSMLMLDVTLPGTYAATQSLQVAAIGPWALHALTGGEVPMVGASAIATTLDYSTFGTLDGHPPTRILSQDQVVVLRYTGGTLTGQLIVTPFDQSTTTDPIMGTMAAVTPTTPLDATIDVMAASTRMSAQMPSGTTFGASWALQAAPGYMFGQTAGVQLDGGGLAMMATMFASTYANPFAQLGWQPLVAYVAGSSRTYTLGGIAVTLSSDLVQIVEPATGLHLDFPAGLPTLVALGGAPLVIDGASVIVDPATALDIDITTDGTANSVYTATLIEYAVVAGAVTQTRVFTIAGPDPHLTLPPGVLQVGHTYAVSAVGIAGGYPNAGSGDLATFSLPISYGVLTSAVFTVAAP
jgi:hypothetical protein